MWPFDGFPERTAADVDGHTYDYIIVGGGTAGCVVASRLSEDPDVSVLLLEKGSVKDTLISRIPLLSCDYNMGEALQVQNTRFSEPYDERGKRKVQLWGAEGLGGTSRINGMMMVRGTPASYNAWADNLGLTDWGWDKVEPFFRRCENAVAHPGAPWRGHDGPIEARQPPPTFKATTYLEKACAAVGIPTEHDANRPDAPAIGYFYTDFAVDAQGSRLSSYRAWLNKKIARDRIDRLTVCTGVIASKLELDRKAGVARGVYFRPAKVTVQAEDAFVKARREVIVCSGTMCSPQLLLLSGIGPRKHLDEHGIPVAKDLPAVGANFQDHVSVPIVMEVPRHDTVYSIQSLWAVWYMLLWLLTGTGLFAAGTTHTTIFARTTALDEKTMNIVAREEDGQTDNMDASLPRNEPDLEILTIPYSTLPYDVPGRVLYTLYACLLQPLSRGRVELATTDPASHLRVTFPMLTDARDLIPLRKGVRLAMRIAQEFERSGYPYPAPLLFAPGVNKELLDKVSREYEGGIEPALAASIAEEGGDAAVTTTTPATKAWDSITDEEIDEYAVKTSSATLHFSSTCRMANDDKLGVVDQQLRVHGFRNLRIADASVFPRVPSTHTMIPTVMVAERCSDFVKQAWKDSKTKSP